MRRLLVANRGEVALRIVRAARDLGIETVAVHSTVDADAPHVRLADQSVEIGPGPAGKSYLDAGAVLAAARESGADAVHPGYGFLSERESFAQAVEDAGLVFVGPEPGHIALMGDKARARETAIAAGVPTVPGSDGAVPDAEAAVAVADEVGYPVALKAAGGGGGRGIRVAQDADEVRGAFGVASREASGAFDDARIYVERFIARARHIEVQVLADGKDCVHLFERECSLQRRRQKVVEESPSPGLSAEVRARLCDAAVALCRAVGYRSAGTIEFLLDDATDEFFFIEMNTRIQVEHPVTELVTGIDLVAAQLRIAAGEPLGLRQDELATRGCALELRINAEDPGNGFMPSPGAITGLALPMGPWVRVDTWLEPGASVPPFYDSLLAKLVVWGPDRETTINRTRRALRELTIDGVKTTIALLATLLDEDWFAAGDFHTATLEAWLDDRTTQPEEADRP